MGLHATRALHRRGPRPRRARHRRSRSHRQLSARRQSRSLPRRRPASPRSAVHATPAVVSASSSGVRVDGVFANSSTSRRRVSSRVAQVRADSPRRPDASRPASGTGTIADGGHPGCPPGPAAVADATTRGVVVGEGVDELRARHGGQEDPRGSRAPPLVSSRSCGERCGPDPWRRTRATRRAARRSLRGRAPRTPPPPPPSRETDRGRPACRRRGRQTSKARPGLLSNRNPMVLSFGGSCLGRAAASGAQVVEERRGRGRNGRRGDPGRACGRSSRRSYRATAPRREDSSVRGKRVGDAATTAHGDDQQVLEADRRGSACRRGSSPRGRPTAGNCRWRRSAPRARSVRNVRTAVIRRRRRRFAGAADPEHQHDRREPRPPEICDVDPGEMSAMTRRRWRSGGRRRTGGSPAARMSAFRIRVGARVFGCHLGRPPDHCSTARL